MITFQRPIIGSRWYYGNRGLGLEFNTHPRFFEFVIRLLVADVIFSWRKR